MGFYPLENYARIPGFRDTAFGISYFGVPETVAAFAYAAESTPGGARHSRWG